MRGLIGTLFILVATTLSSETGAAVTTASRPERGHCQIVDGQKLPAGLGDTAGVCAEIERAIAVRAPTVSYSAEVKVLSSSRMAATLVVNGQALPEQKFAVMDSELSLRAIERFAQALANEVAKAAER